MDVLQYVDVDVPPYIPVASIFYYKHHIYMDIPQHAHVDEPSYVPVD